MPIQEQIDTYISAQPASKRADLQALHHLILQINPTAKRWFLDGKNEQGKVVANPSIGYGAYTITYAGGKTKEFYQVGISANTSGISVYIMGLTDKTYLSKTFGDALGKASVTGYCIKFKSLSDISLPPLQEALRYGFSATHL